jgi:DNA polymerase V
MESTKGELKATGFASPAQGYEAKAIDMNELLIRNPPATFLMRSVSRDMVDYGIFDGTLLVVDRSVKPKNGSLVIIAQEGEFLCREMRRRGRKVVFTNGKAEIPASPDTEIFGTLKATINQYGNAH